MMVRWTRRQPDLAPVWAELADEQCRGYSPLYEAISRAVAARRADRHRPRHPHGSWLHWRVSD
jgi:hypothetical protein